MGNDSNIEKPAERSEAPRSPESSIDLPISNEGPIRYEKNPGSSIWPLEKKVRVSGKIAKQLALADSPTARYKAAVALQMELIRNKTVEEKSMIRKIISHPLTCGALLLGAGALIPSALSSEGWATSAWNETSSVANDMGNSNFGQGVAGIWENMDWTGVATVGGAGLAAAALGGVAIDKWKGGPKKRDARKARYIILNDEMKRLDTGKTRIDKKESR